MRAHVVAAALLLAACERPAPMPTVAHVDLPRFMGDWYVLGSIPTYMEEGAHNALESYRLEPDGSIATTFTFRAGTFDGEEKRHTPRGFVADRKSNAVWEMQFLWPIRADYRIVYLDADYTRTVIAREKRDYVWIMARTPAIAEADYQRLVAFAASLGYDAARIQKVPQRWR
jgi:apolipoprotein D and lipocalin family protein